jgi:hypothetical protein
MIQNLAPRLISNVDVPQCQWVGSTTRKMAEIQTERNVCLAKCAKMTDGTQHVILTPPHGSYMHRTLALSHQIVDSGIKRRVHSASSSDPTESAFARCHARFTMNVPVERVGLNAGTMANTSRASHSPSPSSNPENPGLPIEPKQNPDIRRRVESRFEQAWVGAQRGWESLVRYWWVWECLSATISFIAVIVLIGTLTEADGRALQSISFGAAHFSLNSYIAAISTVVRTSLLVTIAGPLNQSVWNWFSSSRREDAEFQRGHSLKDLDIFGNAAQDSWSSLQLLLRSRFR